jgi:hypothetical protein
MQRGGARRSASRSDAGITAFSGIFTSPRRDNLLTNVRHIGYFIALAGMFSPIVKD